MTEKNQKKTLKTRDVMLLSMGNYHGSIPNEININMGKKNKNNLSKHFHPYFI